MYKIRYKIGMLIYVHLFPKVQDKKNTITILYHPVNYLLKWNILKVSCRAKNRRAFVF